MGLRTILVICLVSLFMPLNSYSAWQTPAEVITGNWGSGSRDFGIEKGDTSDRLPDLTAILFDGNIIISDQVNEREAVYKSDGSLLKVVPWEILQNSQKVTNPEYLLYHYWNVQGYTNDGNIWIKIDNYILVKPSTGETITTSTTRPLQLGTVTEKTISGTTSKITVQYPDKTWSYTDVGRMSSYMRDINGNLYGYGNTQVIRYATCGKEAAMLMMPKKIVQETSRGPQVEPQVTVLEEYGSPVIAPSGDVYTWKRTPTTYSILKWTWANDPNAPANAPDKPGGFSLKTTTTGINLFWNAVPQDPGCLTGYELVRSTATGGPYTTLATINAGTADARGLVKYADTTAAAGTTYYYKVRAAAGTEYSAYTAEVSGKR